MRERTMSRNVWSHNSGSRGSFKASANCRVRPICSSNCRSGKSPASLVNWALHGSTMTGKFPQADLAIGAGIKQRRGDGDGAAADLTALDVDTQFAQHQLLGILPIGLLIHPDGALGLCPEDEVIVLAKLHAATEIGLAALVQAHDHIDAAALQLRDLEKGAKMAVAEHDVAVAEATMQAAE